jgi:hypothetical protein
MNKSEAIAESEESVVGSLVPGMNRSAEQNLLQGEKEPNQVSLSTTAVIDDDPDVEQIMIQVRLKKGKIVQGSDSFLCERALLKHIGKNLIPWFQYCRDHGMKTL